jgi:hypothetical protein
MKATAEVKFTLELTTEESDWLRGVMQNLVPTTSLDQEMSHTFFNALDKGDYLDR